MSVEQNLKTSERYHELDPDNMDDIWEYYDRKLKYVQGVQETVVL